jgi:hypothetical protein
MAGGPLDLQATLSINDNEFVKGIQRSIKTIESFAKSAQSSGNTAQKSFNQTTSAAKNLSKFVRNTLSVAFGIHLAGGINRAISGLRNFVKSSIWGAARTEQMTSVLNMLGAKLGYTNRQMSQFTDTIRKKGIELGIAQTTLQEFIRYQLDLEQSTNLARVAQDAAVMSNSNSSATLQRLIYGIATQNSLLLRNAGIQVMAGSAISEYAAQLNKAESSLSSSERTQAVLNAVLKEGAKIAGAYETSMKEPIKKLGSLKRIVDDIKVSIGTALYAAFKTIINDALDPFVKWISKSLAEGTRLNAWITSVGQAISGAVQAMVKWVKSDAVQKGLQSMGAAFFNLVNAIGSILEPILKVGGAILAVAGSKGFQFLAAVIKQLADIIAAAMRGPLKAFVAFFATVKILKFTLAMVALTRAVIINGKAWVKTKVSMASAATTATVTSKAITALGVAANMAIPIIGALVAIWSLTTLWKDSDDEGKKLEDTIKRITSALDGQRDSVDLLNDAWNAFFSEGNALSDSAQQVADDMGASWRDIRNIVAEVEAGATAVGALNKVMGLDIPVRPVEPDHVKFGRDMFAAHGAESNISAAQYEQMSRDEFKAIEMQWEEQTKGYENFLDEIERLASGKAEDARRAFTNFWDGLIEDFFGPSRLMMSETESFTVHMRDFLSGLAQEWGFAHDVISGSEFDWNTWLDTASTSEVLQFQREYTEEAAKATAIAMEHAAALERERQEIDLLAEGMNRLGKGLEDDVQMGLARAELAVKSSSEEFERLNMRLAVTGSLLSNVVRTAQGVNSAVDAMAQVMFRAGDATRATGEESTELVLMLDGVIQQALKNAEAMVSSAAAVGKNIDASEAAEKAFAQLRRELVRAGEEAGYATDELLTLFDVFSSLDGQTAFMYLEIISAGAVGVQQQIETLRKQGAGAGDPRVKALSALLPHLLPKSFEDRSGGRGGEQLSAIEQMWENIMGNVERSMSAIKAGRSAMDSYEDATAAVESNEQRINDLLDYRNELLDDTSDFYKNHEASLARQRIDLVGMQRSYEALTKRAQEVTPEGIANQESKVAVLTADAAKITAEEQVAIDKATASLSGAQRQYDAGIITLAEYQVAQERLALIQQDSVGPTQELIDAQTELEQMQWDAKTITDQLTIADWELQQATTAVNEALSAEEAAAKSVEQVDLALIEAADDLNAALFRQEEALLAVARAGGFVQMALGSMTGEQRTAAQAMVDQITALLSGQINWEDFGAAVGVGGSGVSTIPEISGNSPMSGSTQNVNILIEAGLSDPNWVAEGVVAALAHYNQNNGPVPVDTQTGFNTSG